MAETVVPVERLDILSEVFGAMDANVHLIEQELGVTVVSRGNEVRISGEDNAVTQAEKTLKGLLEMAEGGETIGPQNVHYVLGLAHAGKTDALAELSKDIICITAAGKPIKAKTLGQQRYLSAIDSHTITLCIGPAGTGKTYLAVAEAVRAFRAHQISRIILTRPAVEAGERLGFLPGDLQTKVDPYLRPLYDALYEMLGQDTFAKHLEKGAIEVAPLAYMRGRTLDESFIILDEAQNTTREQMKMFLTRLGFGSKIVITGDVTQIDLPGDKVSGLRDAAQVLAHVEDIAICRLGAEDVVRHELVQRIIAAYEKAEAKRTRPAADAKKNAAEGGTDEKKSVPIQKPGSRIPAPPEKRRHR